MLKARHPRSLREDLEQMLYSTFPTQHVKRDVHVQGMTTRPYRFDAEIMIGGGCRLLIDPVTQDANSIYSRQVAHFDVGRLKDRRIIQRIVYDDRDHWNAADLNLLQTAATMSLIPIAMSL